MTSPQRCALLAVLGLCVFTAVTACRTGSDDGPRAAALVEPPRLVIEPLKHDFGRVVEGEKLTHVFEVKNTGGQPLEIANVRASCGCTAAVIAEKSVPAGGATRIEVKFDTRGRRGPNHKNVTVTSNDPASPTLQIEFTAEVVARLAFEPSHLRLQAAHGEHPSLPAWIIGELAGDAKPTFVNEPGAGVKAEFIEEKTAAGVRRGVRLTLVADAIGHDQGGVKVSTGVPDVPTLDLSYSYQIRGNLSVPEQVFLDPRRPSLKERTVQVTSTRPDFVLSGVRVLSGPFQAKVLERKPGGPFEVLVTAVPPPTQTENLPGELQLTSNDPVERTKTIKLTLAGPRPGRPGSAIAASARPGAVNPGAANPGAGTPPPPQLPAPPPPRAP